MLKRKLLILGLAFSLLFGASIFSILLKPSDEITIGSKPDTEQKILSEIVVRLLSKEGFRVKHIPELEGTWVCFNALCSGDLDLYIEYSGTALMAILKEDPSQSVEFLRKELISRHDLEWLEPLGFENSYGLFALKGSHLSTFSDLKDVTLGIDPEFNSRSDFALLKEHYGLKPKPTIMDQSLLFLSQASVISASSTDARLIKYGRKALLDDKKVLPSYEPAVMVRAGLLRRYPQIREALEPLKNLISQEEMIELNARVENNYEKSYDVAFDFLQEKGLL